MKIKEKDLGKVSVTVERDPYDSKKDYPKLTVVEDQTTIATYISRKAVPAGTALSNREYWICLGRIDTNAVTYITNVRNSLNAIIAHAESLSNGKSAYEIAVDNGFEGTEVEWLASLVGATGATGAQGPQGIQGPQGPSGSLIFPSIELEPLTGELVISGTDLEDNFTFDYTTGELIFNV